MIVLASIVAVGLIVAQGLAVWAFLRVVKSFGAFTASHERLTSALLAVHESNAAIHASNVRVLEELKKMRPKAKEVA